MANEITVTATLAYANPALVIAGVSLSVQTPGTFSIVGSKFTNNVMSVPTTAGGTAIPIGSVGTLGWCLLKNLDVTNYLEILNAVSGTPVIRLKAGEIALFRFAGTVTAPAALANTGAVLLEYLLLDA